jgi:hypothetical protein
MLLIEQPIDFFERQATGLRNSAEVKQNVEFDTHFDPSEYDGRNHEEVDGCVDYVDFPANGIKAERHDHCFKPSDSE